MCKVNTDLLKVNECGWMYRPHRTATRQNGVYTATLYRMSVTCNERKKKCIIENPDWIWSPTTRAFLQEATPCIARVSVTGGKWLIVPVSGWTIEVRQYPKIILRW